MVKILHRLILSSGMGWNRYHDLDEEYTKLTKYINEYKSDDDSP